MEKQFRLPKEFADKWLAALRSGRYKQACGNLYVNENGQYGYCCLGVACSISGYTPLPEEGIIKPGTFNIPEEITGACQVNLLVRHLVEMNDRLKSFCEIADWIEENVELY